MFHVPNEHRLRSGVLASDNSYGNAGMFIIPHNKIKDYCYAAQASDGEGWEHVSVSLHTIKKGRTLSPVDRCPTWPEMCFIKGLFWDDTDTVLQFHPPKESYVNMHPFCLHLWRPVGVAVPVPDSILVGINL